MERPFDRLLLIVTGAHLRAEVADRPLAYRLQQVVTSWLERRFGPAGPESRRPFEPVVCSDLWYLNHDELRERATICIGGPEINALTAYVADKIPSVLAVKDVLIVQMDPTFHDLIACCWGKDREATTLAVESFIERYMAGFLDAAAQADDEP